MTASPPPPDWPAAEPGGRRASDDLREVITSLRIDVAEFRGETRGRLDTLASSLSAQGERLEERIEAERHSRRSTDVTVAGLQDRVGEVDEKVDNARVSLAALAARLATPAAGAGLLGAALWELLPRLGG